MSPVTKQDNQENTQSTKQDENRVFPAPRAHSTEHVARLSAYASDQSKKKVPVAELPDYAKDDFKTREVLLPAGGLSALADSLWPEDINDEEKMDKHMHMLLTLNRDRVRNDTDARPHMLVKVPA